MSEHRRPTDDTDPARLLLSLGAFVSLAALALSEQFHLVPGAVVAFAASAYVVSRDETGR